MKIGEFSKKYQTSTSTVRYYIDKALLTPQRKNGQYIFDDTCMREMEKIIRYKSYRFSLKEIELLFYYEKASNLKDKTVIKEILNLLRMKHGELEREQEKLAEICSDLEKEMKDYERKRAEETAGKDTFLPLEALELFCCPNCQRPLSLNEARIEARGISQGVFQCRCGYHAQVRDGVLLCEGNMEDTPFKAFENIDSVLAITSEYSPAYRELIEKVYLWMYQEISQKKNSLRYIMTGPFSYNFFLKHLENLPEDYLYLIVDISTKKIEKLKQYFADTKHKLLFIAGDMEHIPLKKGSVDFFVDDYSLTNYVFTYNKNLFEKISPLLRKEGWLMGLFVDYTSAPRSLRNFKHDHNAFLPELLSKNKMYHYFASTSLAIVEERNFGIPQGKERHFVRQVGEEKIELIAYMARKQRI